MKSVSGFYASEREESVLEFIDSFQIKHGYSPTVREICDGVGVRSTSTVHGYIKALERKGFVAQDTGDRTRTRTLRLIKQPEDACA